jgi:hypothetical protein
MRFFDAPDPIHDDKVPFKIFEIDPTDRITVSEEVDGSELAIHVISSEREGIRSEIRLSKEQLRSIAIQILELENPDCHFCGHKNDFHDEKGMCLYCDCRESVRLINLNMGSQSRYLVKVNDVFL